MSRFTLLSVAAVLALTASPAIADEVPEAIAVPGQSAALTLHAEGAQVYECKADSAGALSWQFREPVATLLLDGKTVGRHYAGPSWEMAEGGAVVGKVAGRAAGASVGDIPLLKLEVVSERGAGQLSGVALIQRLNTRGGTLAGACETAGAFRSVPYSADYAFFKKPG